MNCLKSHMSICIVLIALLVVPVGNIVFAQTISITSPTNDVSSASGSDFATEVIGNQWDMTRTRDIGADYNYYKPSISGGEWTGPGNNQQGYIYPLNPGFIIPGYENYLSYYDNGTPYGPLNPIDASKYTHMSIRMSLPNDVRNHVAMYWANQRLVWPTHGMNFLDGYASFSGVTPVWTYYPSGYRIYDVDLSAGDWDNERNAGFTGDAATFGDAWGGTIYGFQITPANTLPAGKNVKIDWIRLYDGNNSPTVTVTWTSSGIPSDGLHTVQLWIDDDASGFDGDLFMDCINNDSNYTFRLGSLPPGDYYAYLKVGKHESSTFNVKATSGYSAKITVQSPPSIEITSPSFTSGVDYATTELGNPWDMDSAADIERTENLYSADYITFGAEDWLVVVAGGSHAVPAGDSQMFMNLRKNGQIVPINTKKYRYFSFKMLADNGTTINMFDRMANGWIGVRSTWYNNGLDADGTYGKPVPIFEGWRTYTIDLWDDALKETGSNKGDIPQLGWYNLSEVKSFRFDPTEAFQPISVAMDDFKLCAANTPGMMGVYTINWDIQDTDSTNFVVNVYYGTKNGSGVYSDTGVLSTTTQGVGSATFEWALGALGDGEYFIRVEASDGTNINSTLSEAPVILPRAVGANPGVIPVPGDYNGDGTNDLAIYRPDTGDWFIRSISNSIPIANGLNWGYPGAYPVPGDYNGDGTNDLAVYDPVEGQWFIRTMDGTVLAWFLDWGYPGADAVPGDYNGDGKDDLAVYDPVEGQWFIRDTVSPTVLAWFLDWGYPGAYPIAGDYDGDGTNDLAVFDPLEGQWFIRDLATPTVHAWFLDWGYLGSGAVPGDFDGDGNSDLAVYEPINGDWYIRKLSMATPPVLAWNLDWGFYGAEFVPGDYDGDGADDLAIFNTATGDWYIRTLAGEVLVWGLNWGW